MLRLIITAIIFYLIFKFLRGLAYISSRTQKQNSTASQSQYSNRNYANNKIDQKDIVEAEFVEIKNKEE